MFPILGLLMVCMAAALIAVVILPVLTGARVTIGNVMLFTIAAVPCSGASAFIVGYILGESYTFSEGIAALSIGGAAGGVAAVLLRNRFLKH